MRGTDPPLCPTHARLNRRCGRPRRNRNAQTAGFYSRHVEKEELADLVRFAGDIALDDEIALARVVLRRVLAVLGTDDTHLDPVLVAHIFQGVRIIARPLRDRRAISGEAAEGRIKGMTTILEELGGRFFK
jgi:hypothetical protein